MDLKKLVQGSTITLPKQVPQPATTAQSQFRYVQRPDKGFDFYNGNNKITIEQYSKGANANQGQLRQQLAQKGDPQSQQIIKQPTYAPPNFTSPLQQTTIKLPVAQPSSTPSRTALDQISDFATGANQQFFGGGQRQVVNLVNLLASGLNQEEADKRTNDFLRTAGQVDKTGNAPLSQNAKVDSDAFRLGQAVGTTEGVATDAATSIIPGVAAERAITAAPFLTKLIPGASVAARAGRTVAPLVGGSLVSSGLVQAQNPEQNAGENFGLNAALSLAGPVLSNGSRLIRNPEARQALKTAIQDTQDAYKASPLSSERGSIQLPLGKAPEPTPIGGPNLNNVEPVQNRFTQGVKDSPEVSTEVARNVNAQHEVRNTQDLINLTKQQVDTVGLKPSLDKTLNELGVPAGQASDETLARAIEIAKRHDALGTPQAQSIAADLYNKVSEQGVGKGQGAQILSLLARRSPAGLRNKALRDIKAAGVEVTPEIKKEIQGHINTISKLPEGEAKDVAIALFQKAVAKHIPQSKINNIVSIWKAGLLSGVKTQGGNVVSNATFGALKKASDPLATAIDKIISLGTKERTIGLTNRGIASGAKQGVENAGYTLKTGIDKRTLGSDTGKYEQHGEINLKNKALQKVFGDPSNIIFRSLNAADQPFYYSALKNSLYDQAYAKGRNLNLKGSDLKNYAEKTVSDATEDMVVTATKDANKAVLNYDTGASTLISNLKQSVDRIPKLADSQKNAIRGVLDTLAPFTRVPSAFLSRTVDFTPLGIGKEIIDQIAHKRFDQRTLSKAISEGVTGTGIIAMGMTLANSGQLSGDFPSDPKEQARWKAEGIIPNAVKIGNTWVSLNYLGPLGLLFGIGNNITKAQEDNKNIVEQAGQALAGLGSGLLNQSFVQGFTGFSDAIKDPARNLGSFLNSQAGSVVPAWVNDIANATDGFQRQVSNAVQAVINRIPGARQTLKPKVDAFGNDLTQASGSGINTAVNPLKPSQSKDTPLLSELNRLKDTGNFVFPTPDKTLNVGGETVTLTPDQLNKYTKDSGQAIQETWTNIIPTPAYTGLSDEDKKKYLDNAMQDINTVVKKQTLSDIGRQDLADKVKLTGQQKILVATGELNGSSVNLGDYSPKVPTDIATASTPQEKYKAHLDAYNTSKKNGTLSGPKLYSTEKSLAKESITSQYPQEVLDFYALSKDQQNAYFSSNREKATELYDKAKVLDSQLVDKGLASTKFKTAVTGTKKASAGKSKYNYADRLATTNKLGSANQTALRNLVKKVKITRKKIL